ncbi:hypothetical protein CBR_g11043 [Chara braunii]|uniref:Histidine kinase domain-containing protein n=1 Tax=Chara braunii TaxID=69332 RepID=A0A388KPV9_CHABU|nr:hypothetical protein CBR_g11043 [Chara braunii]|eukprot:GBG72110.1 hypothetical protein CBR_g11043 [Chara braunii]
MAATTLEFRAEASAPPSAFDVDGPEFLTWVIGGAWCGYPRNDPLRVTQLVSDVAMSLAYFSIPVQIFYCCRHVPTLPNTLRRLLQLFAAFIWFCGCSHLVTAWTYSPHTVAVLLLLVAIKIATAAVSAATAVVLVRVFPSVLHLDSLRASLQEKANGLARELDEVRELGNKFHIERMLVRQVHNSLDRDTIFRSVLTELRRVFSLAGCFLLAYPDCASSSDQLIVTHEDWDTDVVRPSSATAAAATPGPAGHVASPRVVRKNDPAVRQLLLKRSAGPTTFRGKVGKSLLGAISPPFSIPPPRGDEDPVVGVRFRLPMAPDPDFMDSSAGVLEESWERETPGAPPENHSKESIMQKNLSHVALQKGPSISAARRQITNVGAGLLRQKRLQPGRWIGHPVEYTDKHAEDKHAEDKHAEDKHAEDEHTGKDTNVDREICAGTDASRGDEMDLEAGLPTAGTWRQVVASGCPRGKWSEIEEHPHLGFAKDGEGAEAVGGNLDSHHSPDRDDSRIRYSWAILVLVRPSERATRWDSRDLATIAAVGDQLEVALAHAAAVEATQANMIRISRACCALREAEGLKRTAFRYHDQFLEVMNDELRPPLKPIANALRVLQEANLPTELRDMVKMVATSSDDLLDLTNDVVDFYSLQRGVFHLKLRCFNFRELMADVTEAVKSYAAEHRVQVSFVVPEHLPASLTGDRGRIADVFRHIIVNACKFGHNKPVVVSVSVSSVSVSIAPAGRPAESADGACCGLNSPPIPTGSPSGKRAGLESQQEGVILTPRPRERSGGTGNCGSCPVREGRGVRIGGSCLIQEGGKESIGGSCFIQEGGKERIGGSGLVQEGGKERIGGSCLIQEGGKERIGGSCLIGQGTGGSCSFAGKPGCSHTVCGSNDGATNSVMSDDKPSCRTGFPMDKKLETELRSGGSMQVSVQVRDQGIGIEPHLIPCLFKEFVQADTSTKRKHGGIGLGLSNCRGICQLHGGDIHVESDGIGKGTTVTFSVLVGVAEAHAVHHHHRESGMPSLDQSSAMECSRPDLLEKQMVAL